MFLAPFYLLLLIPWAAVIVWLLSGAHQRVEVPFLELWSRPVLGPRVKRALRRPPMALVLACLAMLLAILAASAPMMSGVRSSTPITIIIDRGITMSANDGGESRRDRMIDEAASVIAENNSSVRLIFVPGSTEVSTGSEWAATAKAMANSAVDTRELLPVAIADALHSSDEPVLVLSDQHLDRDDSQQIQISPQTMPKNVSIVRLAASDLPKPQVMLGLRNQSPITDANVTITSGKQRVTRAVQLKPTDAEQDFFFDLPELAYAVEASVDVADDLAIDNRAYLVRQRTYPKLEARTEISPELQRMIEVYQQRRPASEESVRVGIWANQQNVATTQPAIEIVDDAGKLRAIGNAKIEVAAHPITANVDWSSLEFGGFAKPQAADDWTPVVRAGPLMLVAVREKPARQVWVSLSRASFNQSANYVIFWANVFDWVGGGEGEEFVGEPVQALGAEWGLEIGEPLWNYDYQDSPGIYWRNGGQRRALNAIDVKFDSRPAVGGDWRNRFARIAKRQAGGGTVQNGFAVAALGALLLSVLLWRAPSRFSADHPTLFANRI